MTDEAAVLDVPLRDRRPLGARVRAALRHPGSWLQLLRFGVVGASGWVVNLVVFAFGVHVAQLPYLLAATLAFLVAVSNNFFWNRHWTFRAGAGAARRQAMRFLAVSVVAFLAGLALLAALVELAGMAEVPAQACAIVAVTPVSFLANKLWSFSR